MVRDTAISFDDKRNGLKRFDFIYFGRSLFFFVGVRPTEFLYSVDTAAKGHLPLTNCLRGTQLFTVRVSSCLSTRNPAFSLGMPRLSRPASRIFRPAPAVLLPAGAPRAPCVCGRKCQARHQPQLRQRRALAKRCDRPGRLYGRCALPPRSGWRHRGERFWSTHRFLGSAARNCASSVCPSPPPESIRPPSPSPFVSLSRIGRRLVRDSLSNTNGVWRPLSFTALDCDFELTYLRPRVGGFAIGFETTRLSDSQRLGILEGTRPGPVITLTGAPAAESG